MSSPIVKKEPRRKTSQVDLNGGSSSSAPSGPPKSGEFLMKCVQAVSTIVKQNVKYKGFILAEKNQSLKGFDQGVEEVCKKLWQSLCYELKREFVIFGDGDGWWVGAVDAFCVHLKSLVGENLKTELSTLNGSSGANLIEKKMKEAIRSLKGGRWAGEVIEGVKQRVTDFLSGELLEKGRMCKIDVEGASEKISLKPLLCEHLRNAILMWMDDNFRQELNLGQSRNLPEQLENAAEQAVDSVFSWEICWKEEADLWGEFTNTTIVSQTFIQWINHVHKKMQKRETTGGETTQQSIVRCLREELPEFLRLWEGMCRNKLKSLLSASLTETFANSLTQAKKQNEGSLPLMIDTDVAGIRTTNLIPPFFLRLLRDLALDMCCQLDRLPDDPIVKDKKAGALDKQKTAKVKEDLRDIRNTLDLHQKPVREKAKIRAWRETGDWDAVTAAVREEKESESAKEAAASSSAPKGRGEKRKSTGDSCASNARSVASKSNGGSANLKRRGSAGLSAASLTRRPSPPPRGSTKQREGEGGLRKMGSRDSLKRQQEGKKGETEKRAEGRKGSNPAAVLKDQQKRKGDRRKQTKESRAQPPQSSNSLRRPPHTDKPSSIHPRQPRSSPSAESIQISSSESDSDSDGDSDNDSEKDCAVAAALAFARKKQPSPQEPTATSVAVSTLTDAPAPPSQPSSASAPKSQSPLPVAPIEAAPPQPVTGPQNGPRPSVSDPHELPADPHQTLHHFKLPDRSPIPPPPQEQSMPVKVKEEEEENSFSQSRTDGRHEAGSATVSVSEQVPQPALPGGGDEVLPAPPHSQFDPGLAFSSRQSLSALPPAAQTHQRGGAPAGYTHGSQSLLPLSRGQEEEAEMQEQGYRGRGKGVLVGFNGPPLWGDRGGRGLRVLIVVWREIGDVRGSTEGILERGWAGERGKGIDPVPVPTRSDFRCRGDLTTGGVLFESKRRRIMIVMNRVERRKPWTIITKVATAEVPRPAGILGEGLFVDVIELTGGVLFSVLLSGGTFELRGGNTLSEIPHTLYGGPPSGSRYVRQCRWSDGAATG
uniref:Uncharacterized protein n=1 Tax=Chromera velia CCMP2878 TaxID=1169474 RepID=A0A0G4FA31_9ALVE|eukprot:Cvel_15968.t1-p1 / transcript=Cvel_15968.t1 / gene=Cvel_15968 / organism=Chromera_velia_CCMP2878 / gene_product=hypothetical protein / transcript_product=hypothetical protein / location=Cvel_scaffold1208:45661-49765(-) / protein_length=1048 / sequence_SO=supercontig / SO=protein_coding / is_pseudo=false